jgi:hypothetical protein
LKSELLKNSVRFKFLGEKVSNIAVPGNMSDIDELSCSSIADGDFTNVEVAEFLGNGAACGPINAAFVIIEEREAKRSVADIR